VPDLINNFLSLGKLHGHYNKRRDIQNLSSHRGKIVNNKMVVDQMFLIHAIVKSLPRRCLKVEEENIEDLWHRRYGHVNHKFIAVMQKKCMVKGLPKFKKVDGVCKVCNIGKQHRDKIPKKSHWSASEKLESVHGDLFGPIYPISNGGKRYLLVLVDNYSPKTWIYFHANKKR